MQIPQQVETEAPRRQRPRDTAAIPRYRAGARYDDLPDWALLGIAEVALLTRMTKSKIEEFVKKGEFAAPSRHGKARVWSLGYVRQWCIEKGTPFVAARASEQEDAA
ncbi:MAG: hypothetical protein EA376_00040 [Phycisphaeraceae bacterium]|nr:MAG: hypothetical protein EA376_00040 [Phycisphaeraceae bacterium]